MPATSDSGPPPARQRISLHAGIRTWWVLTAFSALAVSGVDAVLLQQRKAFFTGGFLAVHHTRSVLEAVAFAGASLLADAAVLGGLIALVLLATAGLRLTTAARVVVVVTLATAPLLIADVVSYGLLSYLGDAFDLGLMFDLTGRRPDEILAVSSAHLWNRLPLLAICLGVMAALVWLLNSVPRGTVAVRAGIPRKIVMPCVLLFASGLVISGVVRSASETIDDGLGRKPTGQLFEWLTNKVTDVDADGFGIGSAVADPDPFDRDIFPYAVEIEGNGIDENGVGGDLPVAPPGPRQPSSALAWRRRPDVVLVVLESFRADVVGRVVDGKAVTPVLSDLAGRGISARAAFSHNGYTAQSRFHTLSGSFVSAGAGGTLIDDFKANGYDVAYISGQDESFGGPRLAIGFDRADFAYDARQDRARRYSAFTTPGSLAVPFNVVQERVVEFLDQRTGDRPLFLYVNFHDTHYPYHHPGMLALVSDVLLREKDIGPRRAAELRAMYDNSAANVDRAVGATLDVVSRRLGRQPAVIVTADHGESLFEEGFLGHGYALNDAQTRIPLIAAGLPLRIDEPVGQIEFRDLLGRALSEPNDTMPPAATARAGKVVFQYLGNIDRPRQIAFATGSTRRIFDFRTGLYQEEGRTWSRPEALRGGAREQFVELIHYWERMIRAGLPSARPGDPE